MLELFDVIESYINQIIVPLNWLMLILIIGGGIYLTFISKANPLIKINQGFRLLLKKDNSLVGISRFQALSAVLAATVGLGNISGVSIAINQGGPGVQSPRCVANFNNRQQCVRHNVPSTCPNAAQISASDQVASPYYMSADE